ncbi:MAG: hypothetical protein K9L68_08620 [Spirochaetales bacterium]|nr:hypothetical protein [Spirochaetales bacterium]MCF7938648.1 hypothetical protein [Spirochaetales bacterium]
MDQQIPQQEPVATEQTILALTQHISAQQAEAVLSAAASQFNTQIQRRIYYPYYWVHFHYSVKTVLGKRDIEAYCFVDLINNLASTADRFESETISVPANNVLQSKMDEEAAYKTARTYLLHSSIHKMKALLLPKYEIVQKAFVYKPFWIARCTNANREQFHMLVDGVTGKYEALTLDGDS